MKLHFASRFQSALFPLGLMASLAALTWWLAQTVELPPEDMTGRFRHDPDAMVDHFSVRKFDTQGILQYVLTADHLSHYPDDQSSDVTGPRLSFLRPDRPASTLTADEAHSNGDGSEIQLRGNVRWQRAASADGLPMEGITDTMQVFPDAETAHTDRPVRFTQGRTWLTGVGLDMDNATRIFTLRANVQGSFDRRQKK